MELPVGIKKVVRVPDLGTTPARCYRDTGVVLVNGKMWDTLHPDLQYFILAHEAGHIVYNTDNEFLADEYARKSYLKSGRSLKNAVKALTDVLSFSGGLKDEHLLRLEKQFNEILKYDYEQNGNILAKPDNTMCTNCENHTVAFPLSGEQLENSFLGICLTKECKERKQEKHDAKMAKQAAKTNLINARAESKVLSASAKNTLAEQGILSGVGALGGQKQTVLAGGAAPEETIMGMPKMAFYGALALVVAIIAFLVWKLKNR